MFELPVVLSLPLSLRPERYRRWVQAGNWPAQPVALTGDIK
jgi:hypothetical protein